MHELTVLRDLVILLAVAIPVAALAHRARLPTVAGFLLTGLAIGPHGFALISRPETVSSLAELGVMLLLFTIGLEFSVTRIVRLGRLVLQGGVLQVAGTLVAAAIAVSVWLEAPWNRAMFYGSLVALSSTAIVLKLYADRVELDSPPGRVVVSILLFQDICVVPLMLLVPVFAQVGSGPLVGLWAEVATSLLVVAVLMLAGRVAVPWILDRVVPLEEQGALYVMRRVRRSRSRVRDREFRSIPCARNLPRGAGDLRIGVWTPGRFGRSPFRDTFSGIFFISVGMLLDIGFVGSRPVLVLGAAVAILLLKIAMTTGAVAHLRRGFGPV